jgi:hypothetical protein
MSNVDYNFKIIQTDMRSLFSQSSKQQKLIDNLQERVLQLEKTTHDISTQTLIQVPDNDSDIRGREAERALVQPLSDIVHLNTPGKSVGTLTDD